MINDKSNNNNNLYKYYKQGNNNQTHPHPTVTTKFLKQTISKLNMIL